MKYAIKILGLWAAALAAGLLLALISIPRRAQGAEIEPELSVNSVVLGRQTTPLKLKAALGVDVLGPDGLPRLGVPIASGDYKGIGTISGAAVYVRVHIDDSGRVDEIEAKFSPVLGWSRIVPAALDKWGKPSSSISAPVSNAFGRVVQDEQLVWTFPAIGSVELTHYVDADEGQILLRSGDRAHTNRPVNMEKPR